MKTLDLEKYGVSELHKVEIGQVVGGVGLGTNVGRAAWWLATTVVAFAVDQYDDIKKGWNAAADGKPYNYPDK
ncbi:hypothetical protein [Runella sp.]|uniref:hypothetical protein n=1 Tax=Runella sp. TaxID=1960881 RepID=UPI003D0DDD06